MTFQLPIGLRNLRSRFNTNGFDIRLVGGYVRDRLMSDHAPKDVDLCTDASPDEQAAIYRTYNIRHIDTGLQHGTWTVVIDNVTYEVTSLRTETNCDGRHATVSYTRDWLLDLSRRDLTINAMQMAFDGTLIDPYDGKSDLKNRIVKFVGEPDQRMQEDYLRILRWFRFHARIAKGKFSTNDVITVEAIKRNMAGLRHISRERVWSEISRIISDDHGLTQFLQMLILGVNEYIDLPAPILYDKDISFVRLEKAHNNTRNPVALMAAYLGSSDKVDHLATAWRWSNDDRDLALLIAKYVENERIIDPLRNAKREIALNAVPVAWMKEVMYVLGNPVYANLLGHWNVPVFPVGGDDLIALGMKPGREMGITLDNLRNMWEQTNYSMTKDELLATIP